MNARSRLHLFPSVPCCVVCGGYCAAALSSLRTRQLTPQLEDGSRHVVTCSSAPRSSARSTRGQCSTTQTTCRPRHTYARALHYTTQHNPDRQPLSQSLAFLHRTSLPLPPLPSLLTARRSQPPLFSRLCPSLTAWLLFPRLLSSLQPAAHCYHLPLVLVCVVSCCVTLCCFLLCCVVLCVAV